MKKIAATAMLIAAFAVTSYGQGTIQFSNSSGSTIRFQDGTVLPVGGDFTVGLYYGPAGTAEDQLMLVPGALDTIGPISGRFNGPLVSIEDIAPQGTATLQVRVWSTAGGSNYDEVLNSGNASFFIGESGIWEQELGTQTQPGVFTAEFDGIGNTRPVPEPSAIAFAILGGLGLLLFRRRK